MMEKASTKVNDAATVSQGHSVSNPRPISLPRIVRRDLPLDQSHNHVQVELKVHRNRFFDLFHLIRRDAFHWLVRRRAVVSVTWLLLIWTGVIVIFAGLYVMADTNDGDLPCGLGIDGNPITFEASFAFSLQTCTTVGYTLPSGSNAFFEKCPSIQITIYFQMVWSMLFNAFFFAFFYSRLGKCNSRAAQVLFSRKAIVSIMADGQARFQVRVFDVDSQHAVVEAHARIYAVRHDRPVPRPLRLLQPNDELGGRLFLSLPSVLSHHIDHYSVLYPERLRSPHVTLSGLVLRQADSVTFNRKEVNCPICAESYSTIESWIRHVRLNQILEEKDDLPVEGTHQSIAEADMQEKLDLLAPFTDLAALREHFEAEISEVICLVEGINPFTSGTFQAMQSYRFEDIVWNKTAAFHPCVKADGKVIRVDLDRFHRVEETSTVTSRHTPMQKQLSTRLHDAVFWEETQLGSSSNDETPSRLATVEEGKAE